MLLWDWRGQRRLAALAVGLFSSLFALSCDLHTAKAQPSRAAEIRAELARMDADDPIERILAAQEMLQSPDPIRRSLALPRALAGADPRVRAEALTYLVSVQRQLILDATLPPPSNTGRTETPFLRQLRETPTLTINFGPMDAATRRFQASISSYQSSAAGQVSTGGIEMAYYSCSVRIRGAEGNVLVGVFRCGDEAVALRGSLP